MTLTRITLLQAESLEFRANGFAECDDLLNNLSTPYSLAATRLRTRPRRCRSQLGIRTAIKPSPQSMSVGTSLPLDELTSFSIRLRSGEYVMECATGGWLRVYGAGGELVSPFDFGRGTQRIVQGPAEMPTLTAPPALAITGLVENLLRHVKTVTGHQAVPARLAPPAQWTLNLPSQIPSPRGEPGRNGAGLYPGVRELYSSTRLQAPTITALLPASLVPFRGRQPVSPRSGQSAVAFTQGTTGTDEFCWEAVFAEHSRKLRPTPRSNDAGDNYRDQRGGSSSYEVSSPTGPSAGTASPPVPSTVLGRVPLTPTDREALLERAVQCQTRGEILDRLARPPWG